MADAITLGGLGMREYKSRSEIDESLRWDTGALYASNQAWEEEFAAARESVQGDPFSAVRGSLGKGPETVLKGIELSVELQERLTRLYMFAHLKSDEDTRVAEYQGMLGRVSMVSAEFAEKASFFDPELLALPSGRLEEYVQSPVLAPYRHLLENLIRNKTHVLSDESEAMLASFSDVFSGIGRVFSQLTNADFNHGSFSVDGVEYTVTEGRLPVLLENPDRSVRRLAYERLFDTYLHHKNAVSALFAASVKKDVAVARAKRFETAREMALFTHNIPVEVYDALIAGVRNNVGHVHRYLDLRRRRLGIDKVRLYDKYVPLVEMKQKEYPFEEGYALVREGLGALGDEYAAILSQAREERWIDVYETPGKRSGAYSSGFYGSYPYLLLNYHGTFDSVSTLAHELGHSVHTFLAGKTQPPVYSDYSIFLAEIASTVNETLLVNHLLESTQEDETRAALINQQLDSLTATIYRQTMFAEFELRTHERVERGEELTHDALCELYASINADFHGPAYEDDERSPAEWSRIPHFYHAFYVFQYATGMSAALVFADRIRRSGGAEVEKYLGFLRSGSKDYPLAVLKEAGLDMTDPAVVGQALSIYGSRVAELERLLG